MLIVLSINLSMTSCRAVIFCLALHGYAFEETFFLKFNEFKTTLEVSNSYKILPDIQLFCNNLY